MEKECHNILNKAIEKGNHLEDESFQEIWSYLIGQNRRFYDMDMHHVEGWVMDWKELWKVTQLFAVSIIGAETTKIVSYPRLSQFITEIRRTDKKIEFIQDLEMFKKQFPISI